MNTKDPRYTHVEMTDKLYNGIVIKYVCGFWELVLETETLRITSPQVRRKICDICEAEYVTLGHDGIPGSVKESDNDGQMYIL